MKHTRETCLQDILQNILQIEDFTRSCTTFKEFEQNTLVKKAVERNLTIIGEAIKRLLALDMSIPINECAANYFHAQYYRA
ncbi:MAG: DUF86 domain-containing protein [Candidatus Kapaibacteriota bacterium]|jgi:uncharacterized protein with HEPN domain